MALTAARKKANAKYEAKAYDKTLIRLPKGRLDEIRAHIEPTGESLNGFIGRAIAEAMERDDGGTASSGPQKAVGAAQEVETVSFPSDALEATQEASERTGEAVAEFLARAAKAQAKRDELSLHMGLNPVTGEKLQQSKEGGTDYK